MKPSDKREEGGDIGEEIEKKRGEERGREEERRGRGRG